jgi:hypothetical protein
MNIFRNVNKSFIVTFVLSFCAFHFSCFLSTIDLFIVRRRTDCSRSNNKFNCQLTKLESFAFRKVRIHLFRNRIDRSIVYYVEYSFVSYGQSLTRKETTNDISDIHLTRTNACNDIESVYFVNRLDKAE